MVVSLPQGLENQKTTFQSPPSAPRRCWSLSQRVKGQPTRPFGASLPHLMADAGLLQQVLLHAGAFDHSAAVEEDLQVLAEAAGVVVADGFGVPEGCVGLKTVMLRAAWSSAGVDVAVGRPGRTFQDGVGLQDEPLRPLLGHLAADGCQVVQDELGTLRLPCPRLAAEEKRRV